MKKIFFSILFFSIALSPQLISNPYVTAAFYVLKEDRHRTSQIKA